MITLITGATGDGKTLYTIDTVNQLAKETGRKVFYHGIKDLNLDWQQLDNPEHWHLSPDKSIIVIDECQELFRPRSSSQKLQDYSMALETHRHKGQDLFLITQHPMQIDSHARRLCKKHVHIKRKFGAESAILHTFTEVADYPEKSRSLSVKSNYQYPKDVYNFYKSAEIHTEKRKIPKRVFLLLILPPLVIYLFYRVLSGDATAELTDKNTPVDIKETIQADIPSNTKFTKSNNNENQPITLAQYVESYHPRLEGLPHTADRYDELTKPATFPRVAGCVLIRNTCTCYTQQATRIATPRNVCEQIVKNGYFEEYAIPEIQNLENEPVKESENTQLSQNTSMDFSHKPLGMQRQSSPNNATK